MEDNIEIEIIGETNKGNEQIIINNKHKFNFSFQRKDKSWHVEIITELKSQFQLFTFQ